MVSQQIKEAIFTFGEFFCGLYIINYISFKFHFCDKKYIAAIILGLFLIFISALIPSKGDMLIFYNFIKSFNNSIPDFLPPQFSPLQ